MLFFRLAFTYDSIWPQRANFDTLCCFAFSLIKVKLTCNRLAKVFHQLVSPRKSTKVGNNECIFPLEWAHAQNYVEIFFSPHLELVSTAASIFLLEA